MWPLQDLLDLDSEELCLIDSQISSLRDVPAGIRVQVLNLHCNRIAKIEALDRLTSLCHLDLSSNQVQRIEGLNALVSLRSLNLSCNLITAVTGLENLRSLAKLNLSYNRVDDLSGLRRLHRDNASFAHLELHGNCIASWRHLVECLASCAYLRHLVVSRGAATNPFCEQTQGCWQAVMSSLPQLSDLDGLDRQGRPALADNTPTDIPGLQNFKDYLLPCKQSVADPISVTTPKIDAALHLFRTREVMPSSSPSAELSSLAPPSNDVTSATEVATPGDRDLRLERLEDQLQQLMMGRNSEREEKVSSSSGAKQPGHTQSLVHTAKRDIDETDESEGSIGRRPKVNSNARKWKPRPAANRKAAGSAKPKATKSPSVPSSPCGSDDNLAVRGAKATSDCRSPTPASSPVTGVRQRSSVRPDVLNDSQRRDSIQASYQRLISDLDAERERRWKAEQTSDTLLKEVQQLHNKARDEEERRDTTAMTSGRLKVALTSEHDAKLHALEENVLLKDQLRETASKLATTRHKEEECRAALRAMEDAALTTEQEQRREAAARTKSEQQSRMRASAAARQGELLRAQLQQVQELLVSRETEHRKDLEGRYALNSCELRSVIERELEKSQKLHQHEQQAQHQKIDLLAKQYDDLENEFRMALQIEASRFRELQAEYEHASKQGATHEQALIAAGNKEEKTSTIVSELTSMVKEQKGRITELSRSKQEQTAFYKERVGTLETHVEEARRRMVQWELLKREKTKLDAQLVAQESMIHGLKAERKLWGEELAQQGASLSQDRGRLESKIETLNMEVVSLKRELHSQADSVRIKTKVIDDQTETIRKLKEGLLERDVQIKSVRADVVVEHKQLEERLHTETHVNVELQETLDRCRERKDELKQRVEDLEDQLDEAKKAHGSLTDRWKDKSILIRQLEEQVQKMKSTWEAQETKLTRDRDRAIEAAGLAVEKLKQMDDGFRQQLKVKETSHQASLTAMKTQHQHELDAANDNVAAVEAEMRELLIENESNKRTMEERVRKLNNAFSELQQGVF